MGALARLIRLFIAPFRWLLARLTGAGAKTVKKTGAGLVAQRTGTNKGQGPHGQGPEDDTTILEEAGGGVLFERLVRPSLVERAASDLSIEEARDYVSHSEAFFTYNFPLFPRSDQFYEEVEQDYLGVVLGRSNGAADANFLDIIDRFRRSLNANTARLNLLYTPVLAALALGLSWFFLSMDMGAELAVRHGLAPDIALLLTALGVGGIVMGLQLLLYHWPYKVTQQQNLLGLDNYITSKFSRINQKFQVAKRRAMNVERTKRMHQSDEMKEEAGTWTIAYHWLGMRLFFCEQSIRNMIYQIRRNTTLYGVGGVLLTAGLTALVWNGLVRLQWASPEEANILAGLGAVYTVVAYLIVMRRATADTLSVIQPREWNRFYLLELDETIRDHVGEDKLQIVTFRDRNRLE